MASPGSSWNESLCLCLGDTKRHRLIVGGYAGLVDASEYYNEDTDEYDLPSRIDGVEVVGIEGDIVVDGELTRFEDGETIESDKIGEPSLVGWIKNLDVQVKACSQCLHGLTVGKKIP